MLIDVALPPAGEEAAAALGRGGFAVERTRDSLPLRLGASSCDAAVVVGGLDGGVGCYLLRSLRSLGFARPLMAIACSGTSVERVAALESGADDCLSAPFAWQEFSARVRALARCYAPGEVRLGRYRLSLDYGRQHALLGGQRVALTSREAAILHALMRRSVGALSTQALQALVYGAGQGASSNAVQVHIYKLRRKLMPLLIRSRRGFGYRLEAPREGP